MLETLLEAVSLQNEILLSTTFYDHDRFSGVRDQPGALKARYLRVMTEYEARQVAGERLTRR